MKCLAPLGLLFAFALSSLGAEPAATPLEGNYKAVALTREGKDEPDSVVSTVSLKVAGNELTFAAKGKSYPAKFKLNPKAKPAAIDIEPSDGPEKGHTFLGIYKIEKNGELLIAFAERGDRPTAFKGEGKVLLVRLKKE